MSNRITFAQFDAMLEELGFELTEIPGSHVTYRHPESGALMMIRLHAPNEFVPDYVLVSARHELDWRGVVDTAAFDDRLRTPAA